MTRHLFSVSFTSCIQSASVARRGAWFTRGSALPRRARAGVVVKAEVVAIPTTDSNNTSTEGIMRVPESSVFFFGPSLGNTNNDSNKTDIEGMHRTSPPRFAELRPPASGNVS